MAGFAEHEVAAPDDLDSVVAEIEAMGRRALAVRADVTDEGLVEAAVKEASEALGTITMVANLAGGASVGMGLGPLSELPVAEFDQVIALNLRSVFLVTRACVQRMLGAGIKGGVVNVSSQAAKRGSPNLGSYCAAKAGVILLTQTFAAELGGSGINVNAVCPGTIDTDLVNKNNQMEEMFGATPGGFDE
jgi:3-oxoacyl-[acyl-carrier protein] reductase